MTACSIEEAMAEISFIVDQLNRAFDGEAWHGPALMEILEGIDGARAAARPVAKAHCIWELVVHLAGWEQVVCRRLQGQVATLNDAQNFGPIDSTTEQSWQSTVSNLRKTHAELIQLVSALPESSLASRVPGKEYDVRFMLYGAVQHAAYHAGQIAILKMH
jgi:uncharacterized damage-inducible protein DinB